MLTDKSTTKKSQFKIQVKTKDGKQKTQETKFDTKVAAVKELNNILLGLYNGDRCENISQLLVLEFLDKTDDIKNQIFN